MGFTSLNTDDKVTSYSRIKVAVGSSASYTLANTYTMWENDDFKIQGSYNNTMFRILIHCKTYKMRYSYSNSGNAADSKATSDALKESNVIVAACSLGRGNYRAFNFLSSVIGGGNAIIRLDGQIHGNDGDEYGMSFTITTN